MVLAFHLGPVQFEQPMWLILVPIAWALTLWIARQTLSGLGTTNRRIALAVRLLVLLLIVAAVARPSWRREGENVNVAVIVDMSDSLKRPVPAPDGRMVELAALVDMFVQDAAEKARPGDTASRVSAARKSYVQSLPSAPRDKPETQFIGATDGTNLADAVGVALAIPGLDMQQRAAAKRLLIVSDFNETTDSVLQAARTARSQGVPIDVLPIRYKFESEVIVERVVAPATARMGQNVVLRVLINSLKPTTGRISLLVNGEPIQLGPTAKDLSKAVRLDAGPNVVQIPVGLPFAGPQRFEAVFEVDDPKLDSIEQNNRSLAVTFVQSEGRVLVLAPLIQEVEPIQRALTEARLAVDVRSPAQAPTSLVDWGAYDAVIMANLSSDELNPQQQADVKSYVQDLGGGLIMIGGPETFGAGGWIGTPVADALPVRLDPPQQRKMPKGALALLMHSCEMPRGNYWGAQTALAAVNNLSRLDEAGVYEFSFTQGNWAVFPMGPVGNKSNITRAINSLTFGDMKSLDGLLKMIKSDLDKVSAGAKHTIVISDGDAMLADKTILTDFRSAGITISTVLVYPHGRAPGGPDWDQMKQIADRTGGRFHPVIDEGEFARLPSIFIKEAQTVKRALIWEGDAFSPAVADTISEPMRGFGSGSIPPISGYIVTAEREGLSIVSLRGKENDPILAHWQFGLGKAVAFTSDSGGRWAKSWPSWARYRAFWEQHVRWAMRPGGSADMRVITEDLGDRTRVIVEALDSAGERLNFVRFAGRVVNPDGKSQAIALAQVGPGRYEGLFDSASSGAYVMNLRYAAPRGSGTEPLAGQTNEGNIQAAVTRPYADEFRSMQDNAPLGKQVAELSGGRVIAPDPQQAELWSRQLVNGELLKMPVDLRPIWPIVALIALGLFLMDVGVRRVRIDPALIRSMIRRGLGKEVTKGNQQLGGLQAARQRAQQSMAGQGQTAAGQTGQTPEVRRAPQTAVDKATASVKFDLSDSELKKAKSNEGLASFDDRPTSASGPSQSSGPRSEPQPPDAEGGLSRLKKARERAQEKFDDDQEPKPPN